MNEARGNQGGGHPGNEPGGLLMRWLDGDVTADERARVRAHLAACPDCAREARAYRAVFRSLRTLPRHRPPVDLSARITSRVLAQNRALRRKRWFEVAGSVYVGSAAAVLALLIATPLRTDVVAGGKTFVLAGLSGLLASFLGAVDRFLWLFDRVIHLGDKAHNVAIVFAPLGRSLELVAAQPEARLGVTVALALTIALVWFLRQRPARGEGRMGNVAFL